MTVREVKEMVDVYLLDTNQTNILLWDEENKMFTDGEIEYQIRDGGWGGEFRSILVRYTADTTHSFMEFFDYEYDYVSELIYDAFSGATEDEIQAHIEFKQRKGLVR